MAAAAFVFHAGSWALLTFEQSQINSHFGHRSSLICPYLFLCVLLWLHTAGALGKHARGSSGAALVISVALVSWALGIAYWVLRLNSLVCEGCMGSG
ncbi:MAG: hypothetical protein OEY14_09130 [Myxococcales bacterium]|nr:hypothetical protein [Myxococcales bacterium]